MSNRFYNKVFAGTEIYSENDRVIPEGHWLNLNNIINFMNKLNLNFKRVAGDVEQIGEHNGRKKLKIIRIYSDGDDE